MPAIWKYVHSVLFEPNLLHSELYEPLLLADVSLLDGVQVNVQPLEPPSLDAQYTTVHKSPSRY